MADARPREVLVCEVGPRDGLQNEERSLSVAARTALVENLAACGFARIEAVSFVDPRRVPQMADAEEVMAGITRRAGTTYTGLVLNLRGAQRAIAAGVDRMTFAFAVTETFNQRNQNSSVADSVRAFAAVSERGRDAGIPCTATLGAAFGCPFEGPVDPARIGALAGEVHAAGADEVMIADTIGVGVPSQVTALLDVVREAVGQGPVGCHFHNTRNTGLANAATALGAGVDVLDASVGGAGGCPFAPKATGNIPTEDLLYMLHGMGYETPVDVAGVLEVARGLETALGHTLPGMLKEAGLDWYEGAALS